MVVVVLWVVVVRVVVVTGGVLCVVVVVVVVTGATGVTGAAVVTTGEAVVTGAAAVVVVVLGCTAGFLRWAFLWCTARLGAAAATDDVALDVVDDVEDDVVLVVLELLGPPELPQPATTMLAPMTASSATFIRPPVVALGLVPKANNNG